MKPVGDLRLYCPAYGGMCGYSCLVRPECEANPEGVRAMLACLDPVTVEALAEVALGVGPRS